MALKRKYLISLYKKERNRRKHMYSKKHCVKRPVWRKCEKSKSSFCTFLKVIQDLQLFPLEAGQ